jgi:hypothetical protein
MHTHKLLNLFQVINSLVHPISQHSHIRNSLNSYRRQRNYKINRWHLLHHVLLLEELVTSDLKPKIDYHKVGATSDWKNLQPLTSHSTTKQTKTCMYIKG